MTVAAAYVDAVVEPIARNDVVTLVLAGLVAAAALEGFLRASGTARRAGVPALAAALAFASVLAFGAVERLAGWDADRASLWAYDIVIACLAVVLLVDLLRGRWAEAVVADLVVDLGKRADTLTLRDELGRALGDRSLVLGYWLSEEGRYVDDAGRPVELPEPRGRESGDADRPPRAADCRPRPRRGCARGPCARRVGRLGREDGGLERAPAGGGAGASPGARASRRRIVEAADAQRRRLERELRAGAERRLAGVASILDETRAAIDGPAAATLAETEEELRRARAELNDFAQGIHPSSLTEGGLAAALPELARRGGAPVELDVSIGRLDSTIEAAVYFVCSEALANAVKHAEATTVTIRVSRSGERLVVEIADDGVGGADPARGTGLRGLADRIEALGGRLSVESMPPSGTRLLAEIPIDPRV